MCIRDRTYLLPKLAGNDITAGVSQSMMIYTPIAQGITTNDDLSLIHISGEH